MITIRLMYDGEREEVTRFVNRTMQQQYHCGAHVLLKEVFVATRNNILVGAMALSVDEPIFSLEKIYTLDRTTFPEKFERTKAAQLGRWAAVTPLVAQPLLYAAVYHAMRFSCLWGIGEVKPPVIRRFSQMGIRVIRLGATLCLDEIPPSVLPYYLLPPPPVPCAIFLRDAEAALREKITRSITQNELTIID